MSFMRGNVLSIPTAANENAIKASWLIILGVWNDGLGVPFSTCSIRSMGSSTTLTRFGVMLAFVLSALCFLFVSAISVFSCLASLSLLEFLFLKLLWPPSEAAIGEKMLCRLPYFPMVWVIGLV